MNHPLDHLRQRIQGAEDAIRWACVLEATAPKVGNVHPGQSFQDLRYGDFVTAAEITATCLTNTKRSMSVRMRTAILETRCKSGTNVNLGIVLLLGPLVAADHSQHSSPDSWHGPISQFLDGLASDDGAIISDAIRIAAPGSLGTVPDMDVNEIAGQPTDILRAMQLAESHDRVARQYATRFADLIENVLPILADSIETCGDILEGIVDAHLRLLADAPETLIVRKCGQAVASHVQQLASTVDRRDPLAIAEFDQFLRRDGNRLNPGTTADLIAAALYILLRTPPERDPR